jgi:hypothetical protein
MKIFSKEELIEQLFDIADKGWIENSRPKNVGGVGNTIENLLGIEENNLPIPNASEWELKTYKISSKSLVHDKNYS